VTFYPRFVQKRIPQEWQFSDVEDLLRLYRIILADKPKYLVNLASQLRRTRSHVILELTPIGYTPIIECLGDLKKAIRDILLGLEFLHNHGFVHRDVRWANVIRDEVGTFRLIDFEHSGRVGSPDFALVNWPPLEEGIFNEKSDLKMVSYGERIF